MSKPVFLEEVDEEIFVSGNTFPIKAELKESGAFWVPLGKHWKLSNMTLDAATEFLQDLGSEVIIGKKPEQKEAPTIEFVAGPHPDLAKTTRSNKRY